MSERHGLGARTRTRIRVTALLASTVALAAVLSACSSSGGTPSAGGSPNGDKPETSDITVTFGTNTASTAPLWLAADEGIFAKHGLNVKVVEATSTVGATAVVGGGSQFFLGEAASAFAAVAQGRPIQIIGMLQDFNNQKFYVRPEITDPSQLKGKSIAISANGDSTDLSVRSALEHFGLSASDVTLLATGGSSNRIASLISGKVAGTVLSEPTATKAGQQGMKLLYDMTVQPFPSGGITISKDFGDKNPNTVLAFMESIEEGLKFLTDPANKDECLKVIAKYQATKVDDPAVLAGYNQYSGSVLAKDPYPNQQAGDNMVNAFKSLDPKLYGSLSTAKVYNTKFGDELRSSGFLQNLWGSALTASPSASASS